MSIRSHRRGRTIGAIAATTLALGLAACSSDDSSGSDSSAGAESGDVAAALDEGGEITVWAWEPTLEPVVEDFEAKYPNVTVNLVNAGSSKDQYTALQNAIAAGKGVPDVAQIEYYALPQFALSESLTDLTPYGAADLKDDYTPGPWESVALNGKVYGLPQDSGPMALFYNQDVFDKYGVEIPTTWEEYYEAAKALHAADPNVYIANDTGDAGFTLSMIWQAGGKPYTVDGTDITIDMTDDGATKWAELWQKLIDEELVAPISSWSDEWYQGLGTGSIASLTIGAWMPANLETGVEAGSGQWRVAPMPQWSAGDTATSENGGSAMTVTEASKAKELAYGFVQYADSDPAGIAARIEGGAFPATVAELDSAEFTGKEYPYFGDQKINEVLAQSAKDVVPGWTYLPYQVYVNSIFNDNVGQAYVGKGTILDGLGSWQGAMVKYGNEQGFTVTE